MSDYVNQRIAEIRAEAAERDAAFRAAMEARTRAEIRAEKRKNAPPKPTGFVYFLRADNTVKIGFSTNVKDRLRTIKTGCPENIRIVKVVAGTMRTERMYHERYAEYRLTGEWFDLRGRLAKYLEMCVKPIDLPKPLPKVEKIEEFYL